MSTRRKIMMLITVIAFVVLIPITSHSKELGEFCWDVRDTDNIGNPDNLLRLQVTQHGNNYSFHGTYNYYNGMKLKFEDTPVFGSGYVSSIIIKTDLKGFGYMVLNVADLNGYGCSYNSTYSGIEDCISNKMIGVDYDITKVTCP